jgi:transcriptional regulator with XRE-family HTH domain
MRIGFFVRVAREQRRIKQGALAQNLGLSQARLSELEKGLGVWTPERLRRAAEALGYAPDAFLAALLCRAGRTEKAARR